MSDTVMRYQIADFLNTGSTSSVTWTLMGTGFNSLDENPNPQMSQKTYISDKAQSSLVTGYQPQFSFDTDMMKDQAAVMKLYNIGRGELTGEDAQVDYLRVDLYDAPSSGTAYPARKFKMSVEVSSISGEGGKEVHVSGNLHAIGDFVSGTYDTSTGTFTAATGSGDDDDDN